VAICSACGQENRAEARFCDSCGAPLAKAEVRELRKVVTILFCDVTGSTALGERLDSESLRRVMERYFALARQVLERHGGKVEKFIGDAVMAVFGIPLVHEDDALRAARAADDLRAGLVGLNGDLRNEFGTQLQVRIGINTGEVVTNEGGTLATGDAVNVAARLEQAAQPGEILLGESTRQLAQSALELEPVEAIEAKGKSEPLVAHRLLGVKADAPAFERRFDAPFVGRDGELEQLTQAYARAGRDNACHLFTVLGPAGIGKSRLVYEFVAAHPEATVLRGRCLAYGEGITYFPFVEILEQMAADAELGRLLAGDPVARQQLNTVSAAVGLADEEIVAREETFRAVRLLFEALARERPLVVVLDDLHWAEPTLLDLIDYVADWSREAPIILLCLARPEFLDTRQGWGGGKLNATTTLLEPLSENEADSLISNLLVGVDLPQSLRDRITAAAEGNPLFVEQMLALLSQDGAANGDVAVPPTIQALLATRLEQLPSGERVAAERASVIGKEFWRAALAEIGGETTALPGLVRKELIRPYQSPVFPADDAFRFRHQLIRDAAYDGMPKELRAELHERFGRWLEMNRSEYDEIVGYHFEQAFRLREQLGPVDDEARRLATRGGELLGQSGHRAFERGDLPAAVALLRRAGELLPRGDPRRLGRLIELGYTLHDSGDLEESAATFRQVTEEAEAAGDHSFEVRGEVGWVYSRVLMGSGFETPADEVREHIAELARLGDDTGLAEGYYVLGAFESWLGSSLRGGEAYELAMEHARKVGLRRLATSPVGLRAMLQGWGALNAVDGLRQCDALLVEYTGTHLEANIRVARAMHLSFLGRAEESRRDHQLAMELHRQFGNELLRASAAMSLAEEELRAGRLDVAEQVAREGVERLEELREKGFLSSTLGQLAEALVRQGRFDEAEEVARQTAEVGAEDDFDPMFRWRAVQARVLAHRGDLDEAVRLAREGVEMVARTDWYLHQGQALAVLAEVLEQAGRRDEANAAYEQALERFELKGSVVDAEAIRQRLGAVA
jgi:class 3 adenylate cyclase/tetratricopeptide (TPR) repeat protein